jgi:endonuclease/exonuclease/phosphatase (EEP) superfamily protein YafD
MHDVPLDTTPIKANRFGTRVRWCLRMGMWLSLFAYLFSFFGQRFYWAELLTNFRIQFLVLFVVLILLARPAKVSKLLAVCLAIAVAWSGWESGQTYLPAQQPAAGDTRIRVMSFNVLATNEQFQSTVDEVLRHNPDVVAIIEYAGMWHSVFDALNENYPHQHREPRWHGYGIAIFSKVPFEKAESIPLTEDAIDNPAASVTIRVDGQPIRLMACHVMSPTNPFRLALRNRQFEEIADHVNQDSIETILLGDMNCTPASHYLVKLIHDTNLRDSRKGFGLHSSWPTFAWPMSTPIDHVLVSESIHVHDRFLGEAGGSDHRPVIMDFSIRAK